MPTISVIVPVYRVEDYLDRCVESILSQTFTDFELILVDDGSPDHCPAMCDSWAKKDSRIKVIHKENGGLSDARNVGFEASCGEWISFVDSDDYVHPAMLQALYDAVQKFKVKVSICGFKRTQGESLEENPDLAANLWSAEDLYMQRNVNATVAWGKLYHCSVVLPYPVGKLHEDEFVTYRILFACEQIAVLDAELYGYYQNPNSIMGSRWNPRHLHELVAMKEQCDFFEENGFTALFKKRARDFVKAAKNTIENIKNANATAQYQEEIDWLIKKGRRMLIRCKGQKIFNLEQDGWLIKTFYPNVVRIYSYFNILKNKLSAKHPK